MAVTPEVSGTNFWINSFVTGVGTQQIVAAIRDAAGNMGYATNEFSLTVVTNGAYQYNAAGCMTNIAYSGADYAQNVSLGWNSQYQLTSAGAASNLVQYGYDVLGRRESRTEGTNAEHYIYNGNQVVADVDETGAILRTYVWGAGIDNLLSFTDGTTSNTYYALKDHLNTVHALIDGSGSIIERYEYDAWGRVLGIYDADGAELAQSAIGNRYLWQGREYDFATGLYYFRARWYDPVVGRWLSKDPIGINGGLNQYVFCGNNPVNYVDPLGLFQFGERPLNGMPSGSQTAVDIISPVAGGIQRLTNSKLVHEHGFFEDGSGENIGFGPDGQFSENPDGRGYRMGGPHYNDALMREALKNVQDGNYSLLGRGPGPKNNCQDWADRLRKEYDRLQKARDGNGCK